MKMTLDLERIFLNSEGYKAEIKTFKAHQNDRYDRFCVFGHKFRRKLNE